MKLKFSNICILVFSIAFLLNACQSIEDVSDNRDNSYELNCSSTGDDSKSEREKFINNYGYDIDMYSLLLDDHLYSILNNNPIDIWANENRPLAMTTSEMHHIENTIFHNWSREIDTSLDVLKDVCSEEVYTELIEYISNRKNTLINKKAFYESFLRIDDIYGTYNSVDIEIQINEQYRDIVFELKYIEYVFQTSDDKNIEIQFIVP